MCNSNFLSNYRGLGILMIAVALLWTQSSCKKFLIKRPDLRQEINSVEAVSDLLGTAYPGAAYMAFAEFASDNIQEKKTFSATTTAAGGNLAYIAPYTFEDLIGSGGNFDYADAYWNACYRAIAAANKALEYIASLNEADAAPYQPFKGEALLCRAYAHFMLAVFFAPTYNSVTAQSAIGIPYVEEVEKVALKKYSRASLAEVYAKIERDLEEGLPLINDGAYKVPKYHFNKAAGYAFATRFYLHKQDYNKVIQYANATFGSDAVLEQNLRPYMGRYRAYTLNQRETNYTKATENANLLLCSARSLYYRTYASQRVGLSVEVLSKLYFGLPTIFSSTGSSGYSTAIGVYGSDNSYRIPKYKEYFRRGGINANTGQAYVMIPLFTTEEVLFNRAEAYLMQSQDTVNALKDLNLWAKHRYMKGSGSSGTALSGEDTLTGSKVNRFYTIGNGKSDYQTLKPPSTTKSSFTTNTCNMLKALLDFKRWEFYWEGIRWLDILRHKLPVIHQLQGRTYTLSAIDPHRVFQIPESAQIAGISLNPR